MVCLCYLMCDYIYVMNTRSYVDALVSQNS